MTFKICRDIFSIFSYFIQGPKLYSPGGGGQTSSTVTQATIPDELKPYIDSYMKQAEQQLYDMDSEGKVTGLKKYEAYGDTKDAEGNVVRNPYKGLAAFDPMQAQAYTGAQGLSTGDTFGNATQLATDAGQNIFRTGETALGYGAQGAAIGQQGQAIGQQGAIIGAQGAANAANQAGSQIDQAGQYGSNASSLGNQAAVNAANQGSFQRDQASEYGAQGAGFGSSAAGMAGQGYNAQANFAKQITDPGTSAAYMSPYMQNVVNQQIGATNRQYDITGAKQMGQATKANAFGGSREALMAAENERARNTAIGDIQAKGLQEAFTNAQGQQQFGAKLGLEGLGAGVNASQAGIQGANTGIAGVGAQTAASNMALQGAQTGIQGQQAALQGVSAQTAASNMQLAGNQQALAGNAQNLQGNQQNLAGINTALQGVQGAQAGYAGANTAATTMGNLSAQDLSSQQSILKTQADFGAQARAREQAAKDQSMLDFANDKNFALQGIGTMSNLVRGMPLNNTSATSYAAQPSGINQALGAATTLGGAYLAGGGGRKDGGVIEDRGYANGGIVGYKVGGDVEESMRNKLEYLDNPRLQAIIKANESPEMTKIAKEVMASNYAKGGIVAFANKEDMVRDQYPVGRKTAEQMQAEDKVAADKEEIKRGGRAPSKERMAYEAEVAARDAAPVTESAPSSSSDPWAERSNVDVRGNLKKGLGKIRSGIASVVTPENIALAGSELNAQRFKEGLGSESTLSSVEQGVLGGASLAPELVKHLIENGTGGSIGEQFKKTDRFGLASALDKFGDSASKRYDIIKNWATTPIGKGIDTADTSKPTGLASAVPVETNALATPASASTANLPGSVAQVGENPITTYQNNKTDEAQATQDAVAIGEGRPVSSAGARTVDQGASAPAEDGLLSRLQVSRDAAQADANISVEDRVKSQKEMEERLVGKDEDTAAYRKSIMDERANAPDEARRQMGLRLMEFGASWASTPGAPLVAGMKAITATLPGLMEDTKANKKMMKDLDKSEYLLNHATRLEELGRFKDATKAKADASELFLKYDEKLVTYGLKQQEIGSAEKIAKLAQFGATTRTSMEQEGRSDPRAVTPTGRLASIDKELAELSRDKTGSPNPAKFKYTQEQIKTIAKLKRQREELRGDRPQYQAPKPNDPERIRKLGDKSVISREQLVER